MEKVRFNRNKLKVFFLITFCFFTCYAYADVPVYCPESFEYIADWNEEDYINDMCEGKNVNGVLYFADKWGVHTKVIFPVVTVLTKGEGGFYWYPYSEEDLKNLFNIR